MDNDTTATIGDPDVMKTASTTASSFNVSVKPAEFSEAHAAGWFAVLEAQFQLARISTTSTKFYHALAHLPASVAYRLPTTVTASGDYDILKESTLSLLEKSKPELFNSLTASHKPIGRPSIFLQDLKKTADKVGVGEAFIRHKFIQAMPTTITPVLAAQNALELEQLGSLADELVSMTSNSNSNLSISALNQYSAETPHRPRYTRTQPPSNTSSRLGVLSFHEGQRPKVCRAHLYFGEEAKTCRHWCKWPNKARCNIQPNSRPPTPSTSPDRSNLN